MRKIIKLTPSVPRLPVKKRVAAYARVSVDKGERPTHSLSAQVSHYSSFIQKHSEWEYAGVYADLGQTGTSGDRDEYQRLLADCNDGKIDIILTKSISRFARNTVDLLETVRHLREIDVEVRFERENISSMSGDGELMLTILASFAQEESRSLSENVKWAIRKGFKEGKPNSFCIYGYRWNGKEFVVQPDEAEAVRLMYRNYLDGVSAEKTAKQLDAMGRKPLNGGKFSPTTIRSILRNERYTGVMALQKFYIEDHVTHKPKKNNGELPMYRVENAHPAIIGKEVFDAVQTEYARRKELGVFANESMNTSVFTSIIKCSRCGASYHRKTKRQRNGDSYKVWSCATLDKKGASFCRGKSIPEKALKQACADALGLAEFDEAAFSERALSINVLENNVLSFNMRDGSEKTVAWKSTAPTDTWTDERRQAARERMARKNKEGWK